MYNLINVYHFKGEGYSIGFDKAPIYKETGVPVELELDDILGEKLIGLVKEALPKFDKNCCNYTLEEDEEGISADFRLKKYDAASIVQFAELLALVGQILPQQKAALDSAATNLRQNVADVCVLES